ncbi:AraC family transcriptional regulator [Cupriavidus basilensis]|uniref:AraC family transcriptional regulator n=1 Tax=Cupriavidus basilensis TaxID=68895 RepID=A0ABT6B1K1_9BURK|nr:AraC family transcriptional regulator [Cupriavidus basilensis]MDF3838760.1 AraC family transcriptional regulator [Cupriavidus basilensis]
MGAPDDRRGRSAADAAQPARYWFDPAMPYVESRCACDSGAAYLPHTHPTLSIGAIDSGHSLFSTEAGPVRLSRGDVVVIPAGQVHACNPVPDGRWSYQMLHLDPAWVEAVLAANGAAPALPQALARVRITSAADSYAALCRLNQMLFSAAPAARKEAALAGFVGVLLGGIDPRQTVRLPRPPACGQASLARLVALLRERHAEALPLADMARSVGLSRYQLIRAFRAETGMTPHAYQLDLRINQARRLLRAGAAPAEIAQELGFSDQSHFQRAFKQRVALTPRHYQRRPR